MPKRSEYGEFRQEAAMSQQLADKDPDYVELAGSDPNTSIAIQNLKVMGQFGIINLENRKYKLVLALLNGRRKALFATNEKSSDVTKLGLQMPKSAKVYGAEE